MFPLQSTKERTNALVTFNTSDRIKVIVMKTELAGEEDAVHSHPFTIFFLFFLVFRPIDHTCSVWDQSGHRESRVLPGSGVGQGEGGTGHQESTPYRSAAACHRRKGASILSFVTKKTCSCYSFCEVDRQGHCGRGSRADGHRR